MRAWLSVTYLGLTANCAYTLQVNASAAFAHVSQPFTQGFEAIVKKSCGDIGIKLDGCVSDDEELSSSCLEQVLNECVTLYESSGLYGESYIQIVKDFATGKPSVRSQLPTDFFAEGLTVLDNGDILLGSWREGRLLVLHELPNGQGLRFISEFLVQRPSEIWGLAHNDTYVWMTSGDQYLYSFKLPLRAVPSRSRSRISPARRPIRELKYDGKLELTCQGRPLYQVNELEYNPYTGTLWGNVWMKHSLYEFDLETGICLDILPLSGTRLFPDRPQARSRRSRGLPDHDKVWNGVTFVSRDWLLFTGKLFDYVYLGKLRTA